MSLPFRSTPLPSLGALHEYYETETPFEQKLNNTKNSLQEIIDSDTYSKHGLVISIEGTWGSGKTSFIQLLCDEISDKNVALVKYDSLYYGNVSEATGIFIKAIFDEVKERFGVKLSDGSSIAKNITPKFELTSGLPKFSLDYNTSRAPTEVIKERLEKSLQRLPGKMIIVVDDIDRVSAQDVVHFLRLVRVLRELPNFIILLPIDRTMLENLLKSQGIDSPRRYLEKIVDMTVNIDPEQGSSKDLFQKLLRKKYPDNDLSEEFVNLAWHLYLWEISLATIKEYEVNGPQRFILNVGNNDPMWQMLDSSVLSQNGENLVRKFFELTSAAYGADANYVLRIKNSVNPQEDVFQHYQQVLANMTFTDFMYGRFFPNLSSDLTLDIANDGSMMSMRWWNDKENIMNLQNGTDKSQKTDYRINIPADENQKNQYNQDMNSKAHYIWDTVSGLAGAYLPEKAVQYLAPRTLNRVIDTLELNLGLFSDAQRTEDYAELQRSIRSAVQRTIVFNG
jgi:KAP-like P-loop domain-containing protein